MVEKKKNLFIITIFLIITFILRGTNDTIKNYFIDNQILNDTIVDNNIDRIRPEKYFKDKKLIALTFDDGPSNQNTKKLLKGLDDRNARVSFFLLGEKVSYQKDLVKEMYYKGHTIGSHTFHHKELTKIKDKEEIEAEINDTNKLLKQIIGEDTLFLRPPYGSYNNEIKNNFNMVLILWSVDTEDWKLKNSKKISDYIINNVKDGDIVLLHDIHSETVEGVLKAIDELQGKGYEFVSIEEMIYYKNINLVKNSVYRSF